MQVSQTVSEEEARAYLMRATRLVNEGMMLDRRHYEKLRSGSQSGSLFIATQSSFTSALPTTTSNGGVSGFGSVTSVVCNAC
jgi:hypothetical protein